MRIRIRSHPPLPPLKAWFQLPKHEDTIFAIKRLLCSQLLEPHCHPAQLRLEMEDFELLNNTLISVLRDGDLVDLKYEQRLSGAKRKRETEEEHTSRKLADSDSSTSSSTSSSDTSSSSDSDDTTSDSTESESTHGETKSGTINQALKQTKPLIHPLIGYTNRSFKGTEKPNHVPPGSGKTSTRQRNLRRRKKRLAMKEAEAVPPLSATERTYSPSSVQMPSVVNRLDADLSSSMMHATSNANKRKGFKESMKGVSANHKTFGADSSFPSFTSTRRRLVPPSERRDIPNNIIVTSVDVEANWQMDSSHSTKNTIEPLEQDEDNFVSTQRQDLPRLDWDAVERKWESYSFVKDSEIRSIGIIVLWKDLVLNPETFSPEIAICAAQVMEAGESIRLRPIPRFPTDEEGDESILTVKEMGEYRIYS